MNCSSPDVGIGMDLSACPATAHLQINITPDSATPLFRRVPRRLSGNETPDESPSNSIDAGLCSPQARALSNFFSRLSTITPAKTIQIGPLSSPAKPFLLDNLNNSSTPFLNMASTESIPRSPDSSKAQLFRDNVDRLHDSDGTPLLSKPGNERKNSLERFLSPDFTPRRGSEDRKRELWSPNPHRKVASFTPSRACPSSPYVTFPSGTSGQGHRRRSSGEIASPALDHRLASPLPSGKGVTSSRTPSGPQLKVAPRRPSKRLSKPISMQNSIPNPSPPPAPPAPSSPEHNNQTRKLGRRHDDVKFVTNCSDSPVEQKRKLGRRMSCFEASAGHTVFRMRSNSIVECVFKNSYKEMTDAMAKKGTKLLCLDWDQTVVACHTHSQWYGTAEELSKYVRPVFRKLVAAAMDSGICVAFVSFSGQSALIQDTLRCAFAEDFTTARTCDISKCLVRCADKKWDVSQDALVLLFPGALDLKDTGKLSHICSAVQYFSTQDKENGLVIRPDNIVLIDDDIQNVEKARKHNMTGIHMNPDHPMDFLDTMGEIFLRDVQLPNRSVLCDTPVMLQDLL